MSRFIEATVKAGLGNSREMAIIHNWLYHWGAEIAILSLGRMNHNEIFYEVITSASTLNVLPKNLIVLSNADEVCDEEGGIQTNGRYQMQDDIAIREW